MNYIVYKTKNNRYAVKKEGGNKAIKIFSNKNDAFNYAKNLADKSGGRVIDTVVINNAVKEIKKRSKKSKTFKIVIIVILVIAILSAISYLCYYFIVKNKDKNNNSNNNSSNSLTTQPNTAIIYDDLQFHFMQLGNNKNGDAIYIKAGENDILIDAGVSDTEKITSYMNKYVKDNKLEYVIVTHGDSDHIEGFYGSKAKPGIFYQYQVDNVIDFTYTTKTTTTYNNYVTARENVVKKGAKHYTAKECFNEENGAKRSYDLTSNISMEILWNNYYFENTTNNENNYSVITRFKYNDKYFLFTGDLEKEGEQKFVEYYSTTSFPDVSLYKAGHHGSKTSSNADFLSLIKPEICVVSCSAGNEEYTHNYLNVFPTQDFISRISNYTNQVYATSLYSKEGEKPLNGNIIVSSNGSDVSVSCSNNNTKIKDSEWFNSTIYVDDKNIIVTSDIVNSKAVVYRKWE